MGVDAVDRELLPLTVIKNGHSILEIEHIVRPVSLHRFSQLPTVNTQ